jgi:HEAT repeat protein
MAGESPKKIALELSRLAREPAGLETEAGRQVLRDALGSRSAALVIDAARAIAEQRPSGCEEALRGAYEALTGERASTLDPGCLAKEALLAALDALEDGDAELFAQAALYVQRERAKGGERDTAARVRTRGVLGIARLGHADWLPILGACLADADPTLRLSAARALGHRGQREAAGLLLLRVGVGDESPEVVTECLRGLFATAPDFALRQARALLRGTSTQREQVLHALGTASHDAAVELLAEELAQLSLADERQALVEALGLSLRPRARAVLLELVSSERSSDAEAALTALAIHRYDAKLVEQLRERTAEAPLLARRVRELFA